MYSRWYSISFSFQAGCWILSLSDKYSINLVTAYIPTHLYVEANYLSWGQLLQEWHLPLRWPKQLLPFGVYQRWICWHPPMPLNVSIITPWKHHYIWGCWGECLQPSSDVSGKLCVASCIGSSYIFLVSGRACQRLT